MAVVFPVVDDVNVISPVLPPPGAAVQVHAPVPTPGVLPPRAALVVPWHAVLLPPFVEVLGGALTVSVSVDADAVHGALDIVQANV